MKKALICSLLLAATVGGLYAAGTATLTESSHEWADITISDFVTSYSLTNTTLPHGILRGVTWTYTNSVARTNNIHHVRNGKTNTIDAVTGTDDDFAWDATPAIYVMPTDTLIITGDATTGQVSVLIEKD